MPDSLSFELPSASEEDINKIVKSLNANKATESDRIPLKLSANVVDKYLTSIINHDISRSYFSDGAKNTLVRPIYKKKDRQNKEYYRPVSILNEFLKVYERFIIEILIKNWKKTLENNKIVVAVFMDLSKAFNCIPHDLLYLWISKNSQQNNSEAVANENYTETPQERHVSIEETHEIIDELRLKL